MFQGPIKTKFEVLMSHIEQQLVLFYSSQEKLLWEIFGSVIFLHEAVNRTIKIFIKMHSDSRILPGAVKTRQIWLVNFKLPDTLDCNTTGWNNRHRQIVLHVFCIPDILELRFHGTLVHHGGPFLPVDLNGDLHLHRSLIDLRCHRLLRPKIRRIFWLLR